MHNSDNRNILRDLLIGVHKPSGLI